VTDIAAPAVAAAALSLLGNVAQYLMGRRKADAEARKTGADADLADMQAADILIRNLTEQYRASVEAQAAMRSDMEAMRHEVEGLREEVADLTARFDEIARIVRGLPEEIQTKFENALKPRPRRVTRKNE
jgi:hypothetical protein